MHRKLAALSFVVALSAAGPPLAAGESTVTIETRPGVTMGFVLVEPAGKPLASVVLFVGGNGRLRLWKRTRPLPVGRGNFLARSRHGFAGHGFLTAVVDVPSDLRRDGLDGFRQSADHGRDIEALVRWLRRRADVPVWLIGTSRGTVSVAYLAATTGIDGAVLTAIVTGSSTRRRATALDARLEDIAVPVLLVNHRDDRCSVTPSNNLAMLQQRLTRAPRVEIMKFTGGREEDGDGCGAMTHHGFLGIESEVVDAIAGWIKARISAPAPK